MIDIDSDGFIDITSSRDSTEIREVLQNKNLLKEKDSIYSNIAGGVVPIGAEGTILGGSTSNIYGLATVVDSSEGSLVFSARSSNYATDFRANFSKTTITSSTGDPEPVNFLSDSCNTTITYQFVLSLDGQEIMLTPKTFLEKRAFIDNEFFQINFTEGINDEGYTYSPVEHYYQKIPNGWARVTISQNEFDSGVAFTRYGFLYVKKYYSLFGMQVTRSGDEYFIKVDLDEFNIYGVYKRVATYRNANWQKISSWTIKYVRIK